jgi:hypothetical protein
MFIEFEEKQSFLAQSISKIMSEVMNVDLTTTSDIFSELGFFLFFQM